MMLMDQKTKADNLGAAQFDRIPHHLRHPLLTNLIGKITQPALNRIKIQIDIMEQPQYRIGHCGQNYRQSHGLPCHHFLQNLKNHYISLGLQHINEHWYYGRILPPPPTISIDPILRIQEPAIVRGKGRPKGALGGIRKSNSTRREPSIFEVIEVRTSAPPEAARGGARGGARRGARRDSSQVVDSCE